MTARLSPAQQKVVDAMRDGAALERVFHRDRFKGWRLCDVHDPENAYTPVSTRTADALLYTHRALAEPDESVDLGGGWALVVYRLAPAYASALSAQTGAPDLMAALLASLAPEYRDGEAS